ncbi:MAG: Holliday junction branch migration protein RuvA [Verrucomicrobia bacterium]|nr:Holliday junction branch migration protein RuvA [Verrucomicrobiota bacterium]MBU4289595.1 Holliday junction branch migration protein RuvA [Verrucomicrobiota bacterium]MBU4428269.1 Holliday junction branch migration protein RuvA [Verrucomicrobiota bacterium]MCG2678737.1 Holliday junction branch migration protein RuvA [Kiritimatiellia bacterium]
MITFLEGTLVEKAPTRVVLNVGGVGYEVFIPLRSYDRLPAENQPCRILVVDYVREEQHTLFGFMADAERGMFLLLMSVSGIGPKLAMSALSSLAVREIIGAVAAGDVKRLGAISGIGKKMAERMIVELKDKFSDGQVLEASAGMPAELTADQRVRDAVMALIALGYKQAESQKMIMTVMPRLPKDASVEEVVRRALIH